LEPAQGAAVVFGGARAPVTRGRTGEDGQVTDLTLSAYLAERVFGDIDLEVVEPDAADLAGFQTYLASYEAGLDIERAAVASLTTAEPDTEGDQ
ncbi:hypothetical protein ACFVJS_20835, partial [Nocardioides sp. NPDC057772]